MAIRLGTECFQLCGERTDPLCGGAGTLVCHSRPAFSVVRALVGHGHLRGRRLTGFFRGGCVTLRLLSGGNCCPFGSLRVVSLSFGVADLPLPGGKCGERFVPRDQGGIPLFCPPVYSSSECALGDRPGRPSLYQGVVFSVGTFMSTLGILRGGLGGTLGRLAVTIGVVGDPFSVHAGADCVVSLVL
jgi:hypothetical protein